MLPALPTGMASTSGARPRSSQISKAAVFWPSRRNGLIELTTVTGWSSCSASARTMPSAWSKLPSMAMTLAPAMSAWSSLPIAMWPLGRMTMTSMPGGRAVRRRRCRGVAGRRADDGPGTVLGGLGHRDDHAAVLERAGRVLALDLQVQVGEPERRAEAPRVDQRREPLAEGQRRGRVGDGQEPAVALDEPGRAVATLAQSSIGYRMPLAARGPRRPGGRRRPAAGRTRGAARPRSNRPRGRRR